MAAGLGFKDFVTGEVLTSNDVDGYLMQGIWVFADAAARSAAVTSPQEGNYSYLKDTNSTEYYTGSAWVAAGGGGGMTLITTTTLSAATAVSFTSIPTTYKSLRFVFIACRSTASYWNATFNNDTAGNYQTQASAAAVTGGNSTNSSAGVGATDGRLGIIPSTYNGQNNGSCNGYMQIDNYTSTTLQRTGVWQCAGYDGTYFCVTGAFNYNSTGTAITRVDFVRGSTQTIDGTIQLWGIA
jgi:hypothetical protein